MSEIKFRAWDKDRKEYLSAGQILIAIEPGVRPIKNSVYLDILKNADSYRNRFDIEQYTGLKDKNDVEIYEGDMVEYSNSIESGTACVKYDSCTFMFHWVDSSHFPSNIYYFQCSSELEVIGNIHENPELMEGK